jgi:hypothetical protein
MSAAAWQLSALGTGHIHEPDCTAWFACHQLDVGESGATGKKALNTDRPLSAFCAASIEGLSTARLQLRV